MIHHYPSYIIFPHFLQKEPISMRSKPLLSHPLCIVYRWLLFYVNYPRCRVIKGYRRCLPSLLCDFRFENRMIPEMLGCTGAPSNAEFISALLCVHMYSICIHVISCASKVNSLYIDWWEVPRPSVPKDRQDRLPSDAGSCYDASASPNSKQFAALDSGHCS